MQHLATKLRVARDRERPARRRHEDHPDHHRNRLATLSAATYPKAEPAPCRPDLGRRGPLGRDRRTRDARRARPLHRRLPLRPRSDDPCRFRCRRACHRHGLRQFPRSRRPAGRMPGGRTRRFYRKAGHPSGTGACHQRGLHALDRSDQTCTGAGRRLHRRGQSWRRRHRRPDVRHTPLEDAPSACSRGPRQREWRPDGRRDTRYTLR